MASSLKTLAARLLPLLDFTRLDEDDSPARIRALCAAAQTRHGLPAAVCIYPEHVTTAHEALAGTAVNIATVVNFPEGASDPQRVQRETRRAIAAGANEIDMVLPWRALQAGDTTSARACVEACRAACGPGVVLKLILETGALQTPDLIQQASVLALEAGVDFLKTSTGKLPVGATLEAASVMLTAIAEHGGRCGFKAAGGIRTLADAEHYLALADATLGASWVTPAHFRIGTSSLLEAILAELEC